MEINKQKKPYDLKKYFTEDGINALRKKLETSLRFYNEEEKEPVEYPIEFIMLGFPNWIVDSKEELHGRIIELAHILNLGLTEETTKIYLTSTADKTKNEERMIKKLRIK